MLKAVTSREPRNGRAWRNLGVAYQQAKDPDNAIAAFQRALEVEPEMIAPLYNIALTYAAKQNADHVFEWLGKAKATRRIDMTQAEVAPELAPFRSDPGFAAILPKASDFSDPFVEPVKIIREWSRRGRQGPVRLDCSQHWRRRSRRCARFCYFGSHEESWRPERRPRLRLFHQDGKTDLERRRETWRPPRHRH